MADNTYQNTISDHEEDIRNCLIKGVPFLKYPLAIERLFVQYDREKRRQRYIFLGLCAVVLYDLYCIGDKIMLPDIYHIAWFIRLCVVTPLMIVTIFLINLKRLSVIQDLLASFLVIISTLGVIYILQTSSHPNVEHYHTGILVIVMFGNIAVRLRFLYSLGTSLAVFVIYVLSAHHFNHMSIDMVHNTGLMLLTIIILTLVTNYQMEKEARKEYLLTVLQGIDAKKLSDANKQLELLSISDSLTGLANRRFFDETLHIEWKAAIRSRYRVALIFLDIDSFKAYNDNYGHQAGDRCLGIMGQVIRESINRPRDFAARYGGEEFVILLPRTDENDAIRMAENIRKKVEQLDIEHRYSLNSSRITVSLGIASICPSPGTSPEILLHQADSGMYSAKERGRNRVCVYEKSDTV